MGNLLLNINGSLVLTFFELNGIAEVTPERAEDIKSKIMSGDYIIALESGNVQSLPNLQIEAKFKFEVCDGTEYDFQEMGDDE